MARSSDHWAAAPSRRLFALDIAYKLVIAASAKALTNSQIAIIVKGIKNASVQVDELPFAFETPGEFFEAVLKLPELAYPKAGCWEHQLLARAIRPVSDLGIVPHSVTIDGRLRPDSPSLSVLVWRAGLSPSKWQNLVERTTYVKPERARAIWRLAVKVGVLHAAASWVKMPDVPIMTPSQLRSSSLVAVMERALEFKASQPSVILAQEHARARAAATVTTGVSIYERVKAFVEKNGIRNIPVRGLARQYGCSPEAVSQAIERLRAEGAVTYEPHFLRHHPHTRALAGRIIDALNNWVGEPPNYSELGRAVGEPDRERVRRALFAIVQEGALTPEQLREKVALHSVTFERMKQKLGQKQRVEEAEGYVAD